MRRFLSWLWDALPFGAADAAAKDVADSRIFETTAPAIRESGFTVLQVVSGRAKGVDTLGEEWANECDVPVSVFPANWKRDGKAAGVIRNVKMAHHADALIAVWDGKSRGTKHMIDTMTKMQKPIYVYQYELSENKYLLIYETVYNARMLNEKKLKAKLKAAIKESKNISRWYRENGLSSQRGNISEMVHGKRKISKAVLDKLGYYKVFGYEKKQPK